MHILYLDFDGVLHPDNAYLDRHGHIYLAGSGSLFMWMDVLERALAAHPQVRIVLSTSWVPAKSYSYARQRLSPALQKRVIGSTWHSSFRRNWDVKTWWDNATRCETILADAARRQPTGWLAIDDDHATWIPAYGEHIVRTHGDTGLSTEFVQRRLKNALQDLVDGKLARRQPQGSALHFPSL